MTYIVNGESWTGEARTLADLLAALDYEGNWLATAVNGELVHREDRVSFRLANGDRVEILSPMQGG